MGTGATYAVVVLRWSVLWREEGWRCRGGWWVGVVRADVRWIAGKDGKR